MTVKSMIFFATEAALVTAAFFVRNAVVLIGLSIFVLIALSRV